MTIPWNFIGHYSPEEWKEIIDDWEKSNLSKNAYCKLKRIPYSSFCTWHTKLYPSNSLSRKEVSERWKKIVRNWEKSGLSKSAYCRAKGLHTAIFCVQEKKFNPHILRKTSHMEAAERWAPIVEDWKKGGLSKFIYCRKHKLTYSIFCKWVKNSEETLPQLHSAPIQDPPRETTSQTHIGFCLPSSALLKGTLPVNQKMEVFLSQGEHVFLKGPFDWEMLSSWLTPLLTREN
ncbi:MAG: hypothetical protein H0X26_09575 [Alphaproteobacteria bacterium]|nr:hypothetical protein [Alphaproteobacteria bacterium]